MKNKKEFVKIYLLNHVDMWALKEDYKESWLIDKPFSWLHDNGIVFKHFYKHAKKAVELAGYKYPSSNRTLLTVLDVQKEIINNHRYFLTS